jgi:thioredoxin 1
MSENGKVITVTDDTFVASVEKGEGLTVVDFWAAWCGPCRLVAPIVEQIAEEYAGKGVRVGKVDVDHNPAVTSRFGVRSIPSILFFKDGKLVETVVGAVPKPVLVRKVESHL